LLAQIIVYTLNQRGNIPPHALLQWRSDVNVARADHNNASSFHSSHLLAKI